MSADLATLSDKVAAVSDIYAQRNGIDRTDDWFLLKLQEELGELTAEYLKLSGRARARAPMIWRSAARWRMRLPTSWPC